MKKNVWELPAGQEGVDFAKKYIKEKNEIVHFNGLEPSTPNPVVDYDFNLTFYNST
ncbi:MAG: hypothetical protein ACK56I_37620 [bacterium]